METDGEAGAHARAHRRGAAMRGPRPRSEEAIVAEVDLLRRAKLAGPAARLELLAEHARRFPAGILAAERVLLEIEARCALGETAAARALAGRFARRFPGSPLSERATTACGEDPETERAEGGHGN